MSGININQFSEALNDKADRDLGNLSSPDGENHFINPALTNSPYTTNRILEIPQDIKLELSNGTLTLKAGSKVYLCDGSFTTVPISSDIVTGNPASSWNTQCYAWLNFDNINDIHFQYATVESTTSGSGAGTAGWRFNTDDNKMYYQGTSYPRCLPVGLVTVNSGSVTSIDQIFNGFGYIGSTMFALPGVKIQIPQGKYNNGTNLYEIYTNDIVKLQTYTGTVVGRQIALAKAGLAFNVYTYDANVNKLFDVNNSLYRTDRVVIASVDFESGKVTSWKPYTVDSVANNNMSNVSNTGRSFISSLGMPSSKYEDWTLGASGTSYTAPANGYLQLAATKATTLQIYNTTKENYFKSAFDYSNSENYISVTCEAAKGDVLRVHYTITTGRWFKFFYAEGEK